MKLTINQIAELAQVSKGTVSKVLNGHKGISRETRERILKLVKQLDYQPDASARALALQKTGIVGFLIPHEAESSLSGHFWSVLLSAISKEASANGYNLLVLTTPREGDIRGALNQILKRSTVDGLIIGSELLDKESLSTLILHKLPFVLLGQNPEFQHYCVDVDSVQGTQLLVRHMIKQGYRKIGALFGPGFYPYVKERYHGYKSTLEEAGIEWSAVTFSQYETEQVAKALNALMDQNPGMDSLYIAAGGEFILDAMAVLRKRGVTFPEFGIGVFDDYPFLDYMTPRLTAVKQPLTDAGYACVRMLISLINEEIPPHRLLSLQSVLTVRESLGEAKNPVQR